MESVQFFQFGKVERNNSRDNGQKSRKGEDTFSDIMEQSLGQVHKEKKPEEEQKKEDKPEGIVVPAQMLVFPNQTPAAEELVMPGTGQMAVVETEGLQTTLEQPVDMAGLEQAVNPAGVEIPVDPVVPQTGGENLQLADAAAEMANAEKTAEPLLQKTDALPSEQKPERASESVKTEAKTEQNASKEAQWVSEGVKAEVKEEIRSEQNAAEKISGNADITAKKSRKEEQTSANGEMMDNGGVQGQVNSLHGRNETALGEKVHVQVSQPEELPQELAKAMAVKAAAGQNGFEIQITPKNLGEITVRIMQEDGVSVVSIVCSEKKTMELLAQSAREIGSVMEQNLGKPTEIYVEKQENENSWQEQRENDHSGRESEQYRQREQNEQNEKMKAAKSTRFMQELRLGLMR